MGVIYPVAMIVAMPIFGINQGAQPIIGYNYGAGRFDRVRQTVQTAVLAASAIALAGFVAAMFFPHHVVRLFNDEDQTLIRLGSRAMRTSLAMLPVVGFQIVGASYFQAVGKPREAMLLSLSRQVLILIPAVLIMPRFFGLDGLWLAVPAADFSSSLLTGACLLLEMRHLHRRHAEWEGVRSEGVRG
jgi:Na+-driven multidrug efflux pump